MVLDLVLRFPVMCISRNTNSYKNITFSSEFLGTLSCMVDVKLLNKYCFKYCQSNFIFSQVSEETVKVC